MIVLLVLVTLLLQGFKKHRTHKRPRHRWHWVGRAKRTTSSKSHSCCSQDTENLDYTWSSAARSEQSKDISPGHFGLQPLWELNLQNSSVQFSRSVVSDSLRPHEPQHTRPPCPSPTPGVYPNWCPLSRWCHPTISSPVIPFSSVILFSSCPQPFQHQGIFQWVSFSHQVTKVLEVSLHHQSFQWIFRTDFL